MLPGHRDMFTTRATVVAYDIRHVVEALDVDVAVHLDQFLEFVLYQYLHHAVEGFYPQALGYMINRFEEQQTAIETFYRLLRMPDRRTGGHVITRRHQTTFWVAYLDLYYR